MKTITQGGAGVAQGDFTLFLTNPAHLATYGEEYDEAIAEAKEEAEAKAAAEAADPALAGKDAAATAATPAADAPAIAPDVKLEEAPAEEDDELTKPCAGFGMSLDFSAYVQDEKDMIGNVEDVVDLIDELESNFWNETTQQQAIDKLGEINGGRVSVKANGSAYIAVPNSVIPLSMFINNNVNAAGVVEATAVLDAIETLQNGENLDDVLDALSDLGKLDDDYAAVSGIWTMDVGVTAAHEFKFKENSKLKIGASFKYQHVTLYDYEARIEDFDEDAIKDADNKASGANIDLGVAYTYNDWLSVGFTAENLVSKKYHAVPNNRTGVRSCYEIKPQYTFGAGVKYGIVSFVTDVELVKNPGMNIVEESQYANVGVKFDFWRQASLSVGYQMD
ncbi:MAG: conjugal transfer protein TraF, partial [Akkermansia sp.]